MTTLDVLRDIRSRGIELRADGDQLRFRPVSAVGPDLLHLLKLHKADIIATLTAAAIAEVAVGPLDDADHAVLAWQAAGRPVGWRPDPPADWYGGPEGWTARGWVGRLRYLAAACQPYVPDVAVGRLAEADRIECTAGIT